MRRLVRLIWSDEHDYDYEQCSKLEAGDSCSNSGSIAGSISMALHEQWLVTSRTMHTSTIFAERCRTVRLQLQTVSHFIFP